MIQTASRELVISDPKSLHMRPMQVFATMARKYSSTVAVIKNGRRFDGKSILELIDFAASSLDEPESEIFAFLVECSGEDASEAVEALDILVRNGFESPTADVPESDASSINSSGVSPA